MTDDYIKALQVVFYIVSPIVSFTAAVIAYLALSKQSKPNIIVQYLPNPDEASKIDLVIENSGSTSASQISFSEKLPIGYWGIDKSDGSGDDVLENGLPRLSSKQKFVFNGGQFGGLKSCIKDGISVTVCYEYQNPFGITRKGKNVVILSLDHLINLPTKYSGEQALVKALIKENENTTLNKIEKHLAQIANSVNS